MSPQEIALMLFVLQEAIKASPQLYADLQKLFSKAEPKPADWAELRARVLAKSYRDYVPATAIPAGE